MSRKGSAYLRPGLSWELSRVVGHTALQSSSFPWLCRHVLCSRCKFRISGQRGECVFDHRIRLLLWQDTIRKAFVGFAVVAVTMGLGC